jgi:hypothetical protein
MGNCTFIPRGIIPRVNIHENAANAAGILTLATHASEALTRATP